MTEEMPWRLRMFVSVDIIGSSAVKGREVDNDDPRWARQFREFFSSLPVDLSALYERDGKVPSDRQLSVWKFVGDEVLLCTELTCCEEALYHLEIVEHALQEWPTNCCKRASQPESEQSAPLRLKASAWLGGFPVTNREITVGQAGLLDFIGPSIDTGFRLCQLASEDRCPLSADLAYMLAQVLLRRQVDDSHLYYDSRHQLRGVASGTPYPVFWWAIDHKEQARAEAVLRGMADKPPNAKETARLGAIISYAESFLNDTPGLRVPFIESDPHAPFCRVPREMEHRRLRAQAVDAELRGYEDAPPTDPEPSRIEVAPPDPRTTSA